MKPSNSVLFAIQFVREKQSLHLQHNTMVGFWWDINDRKWRVMEGAGNSVGGCFCGALGSFSLHLQTGNQPSRFPHQQFDHIRWNSKLFTFNALHKTSLQSLQLGWRLVAYWKTRKMIWLLQFTTGRLWAFHPTSLQEPQRLVLWNWNGLVEKWISRKVSSHSTHT